MTPGMHYWQRQLQSIFTSLASMSLQRGEGLLSDVALSFDIGLVHNMYNL